MSVWEQLFARNWRCGKFARSLPQGCAEKIRKKDVVMTAGRWSSWSIQIPQFLIFWWPVMKAGFTAITQRPRDRVPSGSMLALPDPRRPDRANLPTNFWWSLFLTALAWSTYTAFPLDRQSTRNTMLSFWGSSGRDSVGRGQHSSNRVRGISTWAMHQSTTPSLSQTIWPRWASRQFLRGCRYETIEEMKEAVTAVIDTLTQEILPWGLPEVVVTVQQVHCSRRRLLRRGLVSCVYYQ